MPYKNKEDKLANSKRYWEENRDQINENQKNRYHSLPQSQREERREKRREWEIQNREEINRKRRERKQLHKQYLIEMLGGKCVGCGCTENLQFDHIDRTKKSFCLSKSLASKLEKLIEEAQKCQLLCEDCHRLKTQINHDCNVLAEGKRVIEVKVIGNKTIVTLEELSHPS
jgi:hypothetical protein